MIGKHVYAAISCSIVIVVCAWFATATSWDLFGDEETNRFYDAQAESLLAGRLDVPCDAIGTEAWIVGERCYGYFGATPALVRIPLNWLAPRFRDHWGRSSVLAAIVINLLCAQFLLVAAHRTLSGTSSISRGTRLLHATFLLLIGLGTTNVLLTSPPFLHHEAVIWGSALALLAFCAILRFLTRRSGAALLVALGGCGLAINARSSSGLGPCLALLASLVLVSWERRARPTSAGAVRALLPEPPLAGSWQPSSGALRIAAVATVLITLTPTAFMYGKFASFGLPSLVHHIQIRDRPARIQRTGGRFVQPGNLPFNAYHYLTPFNFRTSDRLPWFEPVTPSIEWPTKPRIDYVEPVIGLPASTPALFLLSLLGIAACLRPGSRAVAFRLLLAGAFASGCIALLIASVSQRYAHDLFPFLVISGALGLGRIALSQRRALRAAAVVLFGACTAVSIYVNVFFAFQHVYARGDIRDALLGLRLRVHGVPAEIVLLAGSDPLWSTGILRRENSRRFALRRGVTILPRVGQSLGFAASGTRRITSIEKLEDTFVIDVDGPLDPDGDGHPHPIAVLD